MSALGQRTQLKLGELPSLFIVYNITIFLTLSVGNFLILFFFYCVTVQTLLYSPNKFSMVLNTVAVELNLKSREQKSHSTGLFENKD